MRKDHGAPRDELRKNSDGTLDEVVVAAPDLVHLEQMQKRAWWLGITKGGDTLHLWIACDKKGHLSVTVTDDEIGCASVITDQLRSWPGPCRQQARRAVIH